jgi:hypothetical protein
MQKHKKGKLKCAISGLIAGIVAAPGFTVLAQDTGVEEVIVTAQVQGTKSAGNTARDNRVDR